VVGGWRLSLSSLFFFLSLSLFLSIFLGGCSSLEQPRPPSLPKAIRTVPSFPSQTASIVQTGLASWYGPGFHGKQTANGEIYDQHELTAAHKTLPLGTRVMVTNENTNQSIEVRVNDRGPFVAGRIIDLSYAAARSIGVDGPGVAPVRVEVLASVVPVLTISYAVQLGSYADAGQASALKARLIGRYPDAYISPMDTGLQRYYLVRLGPFPRREEALSRAEEVARTGLQVIVVEEDDRWAEG
ncbi:MAG: septal ring lytic transglycosylase RlpA family protein, partial [Candidatus Binatia bacterium]